MFRAGLSMLVITLPIVFPMLTGLGIDPARFGPVAMIVIEMGMITPPVGMDVFVMRDVRPSSRRCHPSRRAGALACRRSCGARSGRAP
ncbi:TRAP transporter large permease subunit [Salipiger bermudensis]|uniref:TRAP transporter large permease subunit n=1 Tax=Salipiger bermudensis TaxID=344736 RepID=UPI001A8F6A64|nr:TRAP transporter large permease subunit [Salipiger bermudensis]MBN9678807.1 TRAP transporter large permease subunit [Salipiger bermudensis]